MDADCGSLTHKHEETERILFEVGMCYNASTILCIRVTLLVKNKKLMAGNHKILFVHCLVSLDQFTMKGKP